MWQIFLVPNGPEQDGAVVTLDFEGSQDEVLERYEEIRQSGADASFGVVVVDDKGCLRYAC